MVNFFGLQRSRPTISLAKKKAMYEKQDGKCNGCKRNLEITELQNDHKVTPFAHGGTEELKNRQLLCGRCNGKKGTGTQRQLTASLKRDGILPKTIAKTTTKASAPKATATAKTTTKASSPKATAKTTTKASSPKATAKTTTKASSPKAIAKTTTKASAPKAIAKSKVAAKRRPAAKRTRDPLFF